MGICYNLIISVSGCLSFNVVYSFELKKFWDGHCETLYAGYVQ